MLLETNLKWVFLRFAKNKLFSSNLAKELPNAFWEAFREPLGEPQGAPGSLQTINLSRQEALRRHPMSFLRLGEAPEPLQEASQKASGSKLGSGKVPKASGARCGSLQGSILAPPGLHFGASERCFRRCAVAGHEAPG